MKNLFNTQKVIWSLMICGSTVLHAKDICRSSATHFSPDNSVHIGENLSNRDIKSVSDTTLSKSANSVVVGKFKCPEVIYQDSMALEGKIYRHSLQMVVILQDEDDVLCQYTSTYHQAVNAYASSMGIKSLECRGQDLIPVKLNK